MIIYQFNIGDKVIYTNDFGVCWGIKTITEHSVRTNKPVYMIDPTETPWFHVSERNLQLVHSSDHLLSSEELQNKYGFIPDDYYGCY